jgi:hypothetical protein
MCIFSPFLIPYFGMSIINQRVRAVNCCSSSSWPPQRDQHGKIKFQYLTDIAKRQYVSISCWNWTSINVKMMWLAFAWNMLWVGIGKMTVLVLSWLNTQLESQQLSTVIVVFYAVGLTMFLLPPVPGVPV